MHRIVPFLAAYAGLALLFGFLERRLPAIPSPPRAKGALRTDLLYWVLSPTLTKLVSETLVILAVSGVAVLLGHARDKAGIQAFAAHHTSLAAQPRALQLLELLFVADFCGYWTHRLFHRGRLWAFHAVHHSSEPLDWLSAARVHPINEALNKIAIVVPIVALGFDTTVTLAVAPLLALYAIFLHANVDLRLGPLRYVVATPAFHRWHHTSEASGLDKNFAGFFPILDLLFGTFYLPDGAAPCRFGVPELDMPHGILGQLVYPFRSARRTLPQSAR